MPAEESPMESDSDNLVAVASYVNPHEAHLACSLLDAEGIQSRLDGEHHIAMDWLISNAVGGVKVIVRQRDLKLARKVLDNALSQIPDHMTQDDTKPESPLAFCPDCKSNEVSLERLNRPLSLLSILFIGFPIPFFTRKLVCNYCGKTWKPERN